MGRLARAPLTWLALALATGGAVLLLTSGDDGGAPAPVAAPTSHRAPAAHRAPGGPGRGETSPAGDHETTRQAVHHAVRESPPARLDAGGRSIASVVRSYVAALSDGDGGRVCSLLEQGALDRVSLPRPRGGCAASLRDSIGYRDPRGLPVFAAARVARIVDLVKSSGTARVTATVVTRFADQREPSVEDDVVYLRRAGRRWLIVQPSATLYRAIGVGDVPPRAIAPP